MIDIGISEFRANMNAILQKVQEGEVVALTLRGNEIAKIVPPDFARSAARRELEALRESAVVGDVITPLDGTWEAESKP